MITELTYNIMVLLILFFIFTLIIFCFISYLEIRNNTLPGVFHNKIQYFIRIFFKNIQKSCVFIVVAVILAFIFSNFFPSENRSKIIYVNENEGKAWTEEMIIIKQISLPNGVILKPDGKKRYIYNGSTKILLNKRDTYVPYSSNFESEVKIAHIIDPNILIECNDDYPFERFDNLRPVYGDKNKKEPKRVEWTLTIATEEELESIRLKRLIEPDVNEIFL